MAKKLEEIERRSQSIIAICALVTSVVAVFIAWDQSRVMRVQQQSEIWPLLQVSQNTDYRGDAITYEVVIENAGVGPAIIDSYRFSSADGSKMMSVQDFVLGLIPKSFEPQGPHTYSKIDGRVVGAGADFQFISASWPKTPERQAEFEAKFDDILQSKASFPIMDVCFCSILEDCWVASSGRDETRPRPVDSCSAY